MKQNAAGIFLVLAAVAIGRACVTWLFSENWQRMTHSPKSALDRHSSALSFWPRIV